MYLYSFMHSFRTFLWRPFKSSTTQRCSRLQHGYCIGVSRRSAQATVGKGLAQGPYMAAREGLEPTPLRLKAIDSTKAPLSPTSQCEGQTCKNIAALSDEDQIKPSMIHVFTQSVWFIY